jgi:hypothetical protein
MTFGNFLLGVAEGLDRGVEAGDRIKGARDRKKVRDAGKQAGEDNKLFSQMAAAGAERMPGAGPAPAAAPAAPAPTAAAPAGLVAAPPPAQAPAPSPMAAAAGQRGYAPSLQPTYSPAAVMGVQAPTFNTQFPGAIPRNMGVMGARNPYLPGDEQLY